MTLCNLVTLITGISMSAVATNGQIKVSLKGRVLGARWVFVRLSGFLCRWPGIEAEMFFFVENF
jgi:hypothetical protein